MAMPAASPEASVDWMSAEVRAIFAEDYADFLECQAMMASSLDGTKLKLAHRLHCEDTSPAGCSDWFDDAASSRVSTMYGSCYSDTLSSIYTSRPSDVLELTTPRVGLGVSTPRTPRMPFERSSAWPTTTLPPLASLESLPPCGSVATLEDRQVPQTICAGTTSSASEEGGSRWFDPTSWFSEASTPRKRLAAEEMSSETLQPPSSRTEPGRASRLLAREVISTVELAPRGRRKVGSRGSGAEAQVSNFLGDALQPESSFDVSSRHLQRGSLSCATSPMVALGAATVPALPLGAHFALEKK